MWCRAVPAVVGVALLSGCGDGGVTSSPWRVGPPYGTTVLATGDEEMIPLVLNDAGQALWSGPGGPAYWDGGTLHAIPFRTRDLGPDGTVVGWNGPGSETGVDTTFIWRDGQVAEALSDFFPVGIAASSGGLYLLRENRLYVRLEGDPEEVPVPAGFKGIGEDDTPFGVDIEEAGFYEVYDTWRCWIWRDGEKTYVGVGRSCWVLGIGENGWVLINVNRGVRDNLVWTETETFEITHNGGGRDNAALNGTGSVLVDLTITRPETGEEIAVDTLGVPDRWAVLRGGGEINDAGQILLSARDSVAGVEAILLLTPR